MDPNTIAAVASRVLVLVVVSRIRDQTEELSLHAAHQFIPDERQQDGLDFIAADTASDSCSHPRQATRLVSGHVHLAGQPDKPSTRYLFVYIYVSGCVLWAIDA